MHLHHVQYFLFKQLNLRWARFKFLWVNLDLTKILENVSSVEFFSYLTGLPYNLFYFRSVYKTVYRTYYRTGRKCRS